MISKKEYATLVKRVSSHSPKSKDFIMSFIVGGLICTIGELLFTLLRNEGLSEKTVNASVPSILVFTAAFLTGIGLFDKIAKHAGAGTLVPITGFANAVCSPAIEFKNEGYVLGVGANIFKIAGPVILYGTSASIIYGLIYYLIKII